jgi:hypothetical protein
MSHRITVTIETGNAAFDENESGEVARILRVAAAIVIEAGYPLDRADGSKLHDINGNKVGKIKVEDV